MAARVFESFFRSFLCAALLRSSPSGTCFGALARFLETVGFALDRDDLGAMGFVRMGVLQSGRSLCKSATS